MGGCENGNVKWWCDDEWTSGCRAQAARKAELPMAEYGRVRVGWESKLLGEEREKRGKVGAGVTVRQQGRQLDE